MTCLMLQPPFAQPALQHGLCHLSICWQMCVADVSICVGSFAVVHGCCERGEGVQGILTLFCSGAAQVCHDLRVVELKEQLEVEEEDGDRQEEKVEVESGEAVSRRVRHGWNEDDCECAQNLSHEACVYHHKLRKKDACSLSACTPRVR